MQMKRWTQKQIIKPANQNQEISIALPEKDKLSLQVPWPRKRQSKRE